ncbi:DNA translocase SCDLUD_000794 [Saccharomycodes ludwigii]|uniref:DNA translocase n=1 Tax=Saccharomycodes ludwigii TaxID=36035 RepID=UPI001E89694D|nr:hypothetical protein SCDLUD_000794 [Saccharomycodes ludwigii]KAH3903178.1 hypothetical protein SCDLUD_000794 [Saccharomycodes ludwigii]
MNTQENKETLAERKKRYILEHDAKFEKLKDKNDTVGRFKYLLDLTDLFRHFITVRAKNDKNIQLLLKSLDSTSKKTSDNNFRMKKKGIDHTKGRHRKTEKEEDQEILMMEEDSELEDNDDVIPHEYEFFNESPTYIKDGKLRDYQVQGLNWLISLHKNKLSGILADEMGLGKTLQTISFLGYLRYVNKIDGPFLIIAPKSTLDNWKREFAKWTPDINVVVLQGDKDERHALISNVIMQANFDVVIASFEIVLREKNALKKICWQYLVVDEAHRIKNEQSALSQIIRLFYSKSRLLITGTPLQNNLHELWALLNFLLPDVFGDSALFDEWFNNSESEQDQDLIVQQLHTILSPFLLRRIKADVEKSLLPKIETNVYVGMTDMQLKWYKMLLEKDIDAVNGAVGKREGKTKLLNIVMQLRKCCNHPYLFEGAEPGPPYTNDEHLVFNSGKMIILDKLLEKKMEQGSRVLIFSQMSRLLDILEDYCYLRGYEYCRIDGSTAHEDRIKAIDDYNAPNSKKFIFLLTTRAGGLGINLVTADTVILYDSDWNPQADLQAMDRAHRIGQKKQVHVFRFVTEHAIEEKVIERAAQKLRLDQLVIQQGSANNGVGAASSKNSLANSKDDLLDMIQYGARDVFDNKAVKISSDADIDKILKKGEQKTKELNAKYQALGLDDLQKFNGLSEHSAYEWNGTNFQKKKVASPLETWINPSKRERKRRNDIQSYSVDDYYREVMHKASNSYNKSKDDNDAEHGGSNNNNNGDHSFSQGRAPRAPKGTLMTDYQFFPQEIKELDEKELLYFKRKSKYKVTKYDIMDDVNITNDDEDDEEDDEEDEDEDDVDDDEADGGEVDDDETAVDETNDGTDIAAELGDDSKGGNRSITATETPCSALNGSNEGGNKNEEQGKNVEGDAGEKEKNNKIGSRTEEVELSLDDKIKLEQEKIDNASEFTEDDNKKRQELIQQGFSNWSKREFTTLVNAMAKFGKDQYKPIASMLTNKTEDDVRNYCKVFWERYKEINGYEKYISLINKNEKKLKLLRHQELLLKQKMENCKSPIHDFNIQYPPNNARRTYNTLEDRFILMHVVKYGLFSENVFEIIRQDILSSSLFQFDWFIKTRTAHELSKRVYTLLTIITREIEGPESNNATKRKKAKTKENISSLNNSNKQQYSNKKVKTE